MEGSLKTQKRQKVLLPRLSHSLHWSSQLIACSKNIPQLWKSSLTQVKKKAPGISHWCPTNGKRTLIG
ncbi:hypothetical protein, partial [Turicimonas muris]|uniref:hypothetical protein n=1 Tax=Turicimonas muris TaxID=1796652 RepID=UPI0026F347D7